MATRMEARQEYNNLYLRKARENIDKLFENVNARPGRTADMLEDLRDDLTEMVVMLRKEESMKHGDRFAEQGRETV